MKTSNLQNVPSTASRRSDRRHVVTILKTCCFSQLRAMAFRPADFVEAVRDIVERRLEAFDPVTREIVMRHALRLNASRFPLPGTLLWRDCISDFQRHNRRNAAHGLALVNTPQLAHFEVILDDILRYATNLSRSGQTHSAP